MIRLIITVKCFACRKCGSIWGNKLYKLVVRCKILLLFISQVILKDRNLTPSVSTSLSLCDLDTVFSLSPVVPVRTLWEPSLYIFRPVCFWFSNLAMFCNEVDANKQWVHCKYIAMFPLQEGDTIPLESYARIKHLQTKTWLHLENGMTFYTIFWFQQVPTLDSLCT